MFKYISNFRSQITYSFVESGCSIYYSWLSLSRPRLSRITAYLKVKIWSLSKPENVTAKYCGKEEHNFFSFPQYFQYNSNFKSPITYIFVKCGCSNEFFLNSANLICRGTDISTYFKESLGIRDNESLLYFLNSANLICRGTDISTYFKESLGLWDNESWLYFLNSTNLVCRGTDISTYFRVPWNSR